MTNEEKQRYLSNKYHFKWIRPNEHVVSLNGIKYQYYIVTGIVYNHVDEDNPFDISDNETGLLSILGEDSSKDNNSWYTFRIKSEDLENVLLNDWELVAESTLLEKHLRIRQALEDVKKDLSMPKDQQKDIVE
jgi:hypothetical protein